MAQGSRHRGDGPLPASAPNLTLVGAVDQLGALAQREGHRAVAEAALTLRAAIDPSTSAHEVAPPEIVGPDPDSIRILLLRVLRIADQAGTAHADVRVAADIVLGFVERFEATSSATSRAGSPATTDLMSEDAAARSLPIRRQDAVRWLRREGLSVEIEGRRVVAWPEVMRRFRTPEAAATNPRATPKERVTPPAHRCGSATTRSPKTAAGWLPGLPPPGRDA